MVKLKQSIHRPDLSDRGIETESKNKWYLGDVCDEGDPRIAYADGKRAICIESIVLQDECGDGRQKSDDGILEDTASTVGHELSVPGMPAAKATIEWFHMRKDRIVYVGVRQRRARNQIPAEHGGQKEIKRGNDQGFIGLADQFKV